MGRSRAKVSTEKARANGRRCDVPGCYLPSQRFGRLCDKHDQVEQETGHPLGRTVRKSELKPYAAVASRYILANADHPAVKAAHRWLQAFVYREHARVERVTPRTSPELRLGRFLARMKKSGVTPEEMLACLTGMYLMQEHDSHVFKSDRHFRHQLSIRFVRLAPAPYKQAWRSGAGGLLYDRLTVGTRELLAKRISNAIGVACLGMARAINKTQSTEAGLLVGVEVPFQFK